MISRLLDSWATNFRPWGSLLFEGRNVRRRGRTVWSPELFEQFGDVGEVRPRDLSGSARATLGAMVEPQLKNFAAQSVTVNSESYCRFGIIAVVLFEHPFNEFLFKF
jgi:hypothetical protein